MRRPNFAAVLGILATLSVAACVVAPPPYYATGYPPPPPRYVAPPPPPPQPYYMAQNGAPYPAPDAPGYAAPPPNPTVPGAPPQAPGQPPMTMRDRFAAANTSHDGCLTMAQAQAGGIEAVVRNFTQIDSAQRGCVTLRDIQAFNQGRRAARAQQGAPPPPSSPMGAPPPPPPPQ